MLALLPGAAAAGAQVPWSSLVVLPGLVAAGTGLLFGVNAFALDGPGALWLASLPRRPRCSPGPSCSCSAEAVLAAVVLTVLAGAARAPRRARPPAELVAVVCSAAACTAVVLATGLQLSVRRPHRADLRSPRDAIAPPGALAMASARLTLPTAAVGVALARRPPPAGLVAPAAAGPAGAGPRPPRSLRRSLRRWADPVVRARVVQVVSAG